MGRLLEGNPELWKVAGDLFVKNMDWPGAQEMAKRFAKTIDPKLLAGDDQSPELQAAQQQMEAMGKEMEQMHQMLQNVSKSMEARDIDIKEQANQIKMFDAETKRISALQAGMTEEQIQDIAMGVVAAAMESNGMMNGMPEMRESPQEVITEQPSMETLNEGM